METRDADAAVARVTGDAQQGQQSWATVALYERAHLGIVRYATWVMLTVEEREIYGRMNQTTARRKLRI